MGHTDKTESFYRDTIEDMGSEEHLLEDPLVFWHDEKQTLWRKIFGRSETPFLVMGAGLVLLVIIFFAIVPKGGREDAVQQVNLLSEQLRKIEDKLNRMETLIEEMPQVKTRIEAVEKSLLRLDSVDASASLRTNRIADELSLIQKDVNVLKGRNTVVKKNPTPSPNTGKAQSVSQAEYHEVQPGETLYRISVRYNISVDSLRRLNGLSEQTAIHPGQKLKVKASDN